MSTLKTHNLQSPDAASVNIALAPNNGMVVAGISTFNNRVLIGTNIEGNVDADDLTIGSSTNTAGITIRTNTAGTGRLFFSDGTSGAAEYQGYVQYDHNSQILALGSGGSTTLQIDNGGNVYFLGSQTGNNRGVIYNHASGFGIYASAHSGTNREIRFYSNFTSDSERLRITSSGDLSLRTTTQNAYLGLTANSNAINTTLGSTSGTSPRLYLKGTGNGQSDAGDVFIGSGTGGIVNIRSAEYMTFEVNSDNSTAERLRITSTGIIVTGGGTAPNSTDVGSIFMPGGGDLGWLTSSGSITFNAYYNGGWKYVTSGTSHILWASSEGFNFSTASSGSADGNISYSRAMKIFTNNRVSIGDGNSGTPLGALHINTKSTMGTDTALWIGDNNDKRYLAINQFSNSEQFSEMKLQFNDNATRSILKLSNPYAPAGYGTAILWQGYNDGQQGQISCQSENANSAAATMYLNSSSGTFLKGNSNRHVTMPQQPSFAAYQSQSVWTVSGTMVFNSTRHNVGNHYSTSNGHFTAPVAGSYLFNFYSIYRGNHTSGWVSLYKNNARMIGGDTHFTYYDLGSNWDNVSFSQVLYLNANDYVEMKSAQSTDWHGNNWQCFSGYLLG